MSHTSAVFFSATRFSLPGSASLWWVAEAFGGTSAEEYWQVHCPKIRELSQSAAVKDSKVAGWNWAATSTTRIDSSSLQLFPPEYDDHLDI